MNIATKIAALIAPMNEARPVVYTVQGSDGQYTFPAPNPAQAAEQMIELWNLGKLAPVSVHYADALGAPIATTVPDDAGEELPARDVRIGFTGGI